MPPPPRDVLPVFVTLGNHDSHRADLRQSRPPPGGLREEAGPRSFLRTFHPFPAFRFEVVPEPQPAMGTLPCWRPLPTARSPLLVGTQSATKSNPLRSKGLIQRGLRFDGGACAARGYRLHRVTGGVWETALYRLYQRTAAAHRDHPEGYLPPGSARHDPLPACPVPPPSPLPRGLDSLSSTLRAG